MAKHKESDFEIEWADYERIDPGQYPAYCRAAHQYQDRRFKRHTLLLHFDILSESHEFIARLPLWFNLGSGKKPRAGRFSRYFAEWIRANGGPPLRHDRLSARIFTKRMVIVEVGDTKSEVPYSVVRNILEWQTGKLTAVSCVNQSRSQVSQGRHPRTAAESEDYKEPLAAFETEKRVRS